MVINAALRKRLEKLLPKNYRQEVVDRMKTRYGKDIHPNTVYNTLHGSKNPEVALEILKLYNEQKSLADQLDKAMIESAA